MEELGCAIIEAKDDGLPVAEESLNGRESRTGDRAPFKEIEWPELGRIGRVIGGGIELRSISGEIGFAEFF